MRAVPVFSVTGPICPALGRLLSDVQKDHAYQPIIRQRLTKYVLRRRCNCRSDALQQELVLFQFHYL